MRRICRAAAVVAAALFVTANASAAPQVSATGSGVAASLNGPLTFVFDAAGIGPDATGTMRFQGLGDTITARVVCLAAGVTHTEIEGQIDTSTVAPGRSGSVGSFMTFDVTPGGSGVGTFAALFGGGDATHCFPFDSSDIAHPLVNGEITVIGGDPTPPAITPNVTGPLGANGWYTGDVSVSFDLSEPESWINGQSGCGPAEVTSDINQVTFTCLANSAGGRSSQAVVIHRDATPPTITATADRSPNAAGWYSAPVTVSFHCHDALSGVGSCPVPVTVGEGANGSASGTAADRAGNTATATLGGLNVDETAPVLTYAGNKGTYTVADTVSISCTASDALSGVASSTCGDVSGPAWQFGLGQTTKSASATDLAGNTGDGSVAFTVTVDASSLAQLVQQLVGDAAGASSLSAKVDAIATAPNANAKAGTLNAFDHELDAQTGKTISATDAALLKQLAAAL
jgi:hypothetical protein